MLIIEREAADKIISAYNTMKFRETQNHGSQSLHSLEILYKASSICENAIELADVLGCDPVIALNSDIVEELAIIAQTGKL